MDSVTRKLNFVLTFVTMMAAIMLASVQFACAADGEAVISEPAKLRWNVYRPYRAEWEWTGDTSATKPEQLGVTVNYYKSTEEVPTDTFTYEKYTFDSEDHYKNGVTICDFNSSDDNFLQKNKEGYYSFSMYVHY